MSSKPKKDGIGYVVRKFPVLSETFILNEILALEALGQKIQIFALAPPRDSRFHDGVCRLKAPIVYVPGILDFSTLWAANRRVARRFGKRYRKQLWRVLRTGRPMLLWRFLQACYVAERARNAKLAHLHAHFANRTTTVASLASEMLSIPYSFTAHAFDIFKDADESVIAKKMDKAAFVVTVSDFNKQFLGGLDADQEAKVHVVRNGIDMQRFSLPASRPEGEFTILAVARLVEKKGLDVLVEACKHLRDRGVAFRCRIVGKGAMRPKLMQLIRQWDLDQQVQLLGPHSQLEIVQRFHESHLLCLPCIVGADGNRDGLPVSMVEALACGLPVISTPVTGIPEAVKHGYNGLLVPERNPIELADALQSVIEDEGMYQQLAANARPSVEHLFEKTQCAHQLNTLFAEVTA